MFKIITLFIACLSYSLNAQDYQQKFLKYFKDGDESKQLETLQKWEKEFPKDAELYTSLFNYYFNKSKSEILTINSGEPNTDEEVLVLKDSTDQISGFIGSQINYDESNLKKAFESIQKGIKLYPNRLDMRFGEIYAHSQIKLWSGFTEKIITTVNYSAVNKNNWTWKNHEVKTDGEEFFFNSIQGYQTQLYNTMDDSLLINMQEIANSVLHHYPNNIESLSNLSIGFLINKQYQKALIPLLKAEKINPEDFIVLNNIAFAYKSNLDTKNAIKYYKKVVEYGDSQAISLAKEELIKLKKSSTD